jgi:hypothetical protein
MQNLGKIAKACCLNNGSVLRYVKVCRSSSGEGLAIATDGYIAARRKIQLDEEDQETLIAADNLKGAEKDTVRVEVKPRDDESIYIAHWDQKKHTVTNFPAQPIQRDRFPDVDRVVPDSREHQFTVEINPELLLRLAEAITHGKGAPFVKLHFDTSNPLNPIYVTGNGGDGVLMPCRP